VTGTFGAGPASIRLEAVVKTYPALSGPVRALDGVSLAVEPGGSLAVVGPSGCGKSTLLGLIGGLEAPDQGSVDVGGVEPARLPAAEQDRFRRERIGFVFQTDNLLPYLTAAENVALPLALAHTPTSRHSAGERVAALLADLDLQDCAGKLPDQLSGGQRLRVAIARAVAHEPALIRADEPTGAVDARNADAIVALLLAAQRGTGATLVVVTHDPDVAARLDRTLTLRDGRIVTVRCTGPAPIAQRRP
jgi:ABC-type lipoprotein export system ATPase subunit